MNIYMKVLMYLKQYEGDGKMHPVDGLLSECERDERVSILKELAKEGLIVTEGTEPVYDQFISRVNLLTRKTQVRQILPGKSPKTGASMLD